jgi:DnaA-homolog protein
MRQLTLAIGPPPAVDFAEFVAGPNGQAVEHLRNLRGAGAPVLLWGPAGSGKTRLLRALAAARQAGGERVAWFDADTAPPWTLPDGAGLVVVDGCERLDELRQQAAFALFVEANGALVQWAASSRLPPVDLALREDLRTRLAWGHVFALRPLSDDETRSALRREADRRGVFLSDEVMDYLLTRFARDLGHLMAMLEDLDGFSLAAHRPVTVPLLKAMLAERGAAGAAR